MRCNVGLDFTENVISKQEKLLLQNAAVAHII